MSVNTFVFIKFNVALRNLFQDICRDLLCDFGRLLKQGACIQAFSYSRGLCFRFSIQLTPLDVATECMILSNNTRDIDNDSNCDSNTLAYLLKEEISRIARKHNAELHLNKVSFYKIRNIHDPTWSSEIIFADLFCYIREPIDFASFLQEITSLYNNNTVALCKYCKTFKSDLIRLIDAYPGLGIFSPLTGEVMSPYFQHSFTDLPIHCAGEKIIHYTQFHLQPFVQIANTSYIWFVNASGVKIPEIGLFAANSMFRKANDRSILFISSEIFHQALTRKQEHMPQVQKVKIPQTSKIMAQVSLGLMCISSFCLIITFMTHALLPPLRTQPGINNMVLCVTLFAGYLLFAFGSDRPDLGIGCSILGGLIHFFWLFTFAWMNVCSFHMFKVFSSLNKRPKTANRISTTSIYILYSIIFSLTIMGVNSGLTSFMTNGASLGYGPGKTRICYIYEPIMTLYTLAVPVLCVVLSNIIMFLVVIIRVQPSTSIKKSIQNRNYFKIYAKLSTITGLTWLVAIPMIFVKSAILEYIFIVFTDTQGIYLMIAFVCSKRVLQLFTNKWKEIRVSMDTNLKQTNVSQKSNFSDISRQN